MQFTPTEIGLVILAILLVGAVAVLWMRSRRTSALKSRFGPEYKRTVEEVGSEKKAETLLAEREKRVSKYTIKPLPPEMREHFFDTWTRVQAQFVDDPSYAITRADDLLGEVMGARGYPVKDFDQRAADLSVDHPHVVQNYRAAHDIAVRHAEGQASTEDLRKAMIHYRDLFEELTHEPAGDRGERGRQEIHTSR